MLLLTQDVCTHRRRPFIQDPTSLVPQLPSPQDLRPFPHRLLLRFLGHKGPVSPCLLRVLQDCRKEHSLLGLTAINDVSELVYPVARCQRQQLFCSLSDAQTLTCACVQVRCIAADASGQWLASGGQDGTLCLWDALTGRRTASWKLGEPVRAVAWCPSPALGLLSACSGRSVYLLPTGVAQSSAERNSASILLGPADARQKVLIFEPCRWAT